MSKATRFRGLEITAATPDPTLLDLPWLPRLSADFNTSWLAGKPVAELYDHTPSDLYSIPLYISGDSIIPYSIKMQLKPSI